MPPSQPCRRLPGDAELIALGASLEALWPDLERANTRFDTVRECVEDATWDGATWPKDQRQWTREDFNTYLAAYRKATTDVGGAEYREVYAAMQAWYGECDEIVRAIEALGSASGMTPRRRSHCAVSSTRGIAQGLPRQFFPAPPACAR